jgi:aryl-alcohol dehydrogenase-like predicted oxidoreductase
MNGSTIITKSFGTSSAVVSIVGLGGEGILRTHGKEESAVGVIREAIDQGITYFDCAKAYAGSEGYYGSVWRERKADRAGVFQASKSAMRRKKDARAELEHTLLTMGIDHLDLWQIHDVRTDEDLRLIEGPGGALEAFQEARAAGMTRFIGVTGHHDPRVLTHAVRHWPVDSVMMPVNPVEAALGGFLSTTLPAALERGLAVIAMKVLGASQYIQPTGGVSVELLLRFALSQPITVAIVGCSTPEHVRTLAGVGKSFQPLDHDEQQDLVQAFRPHAQRLAFYRGVF